MLIDNLRVPKSTGAYADTLVAVGIADLIAKLASTAEPNSAVTVRDDGGAYVITVSPPLDTDFSHGQRIDPGYPYLLLKAGDPRAPTTQIFAYEREREVEAQSRTAKKAATSTRAKRLALSQDVAADQAVNPDLQVFKIYNSMRTGSDTYNQLHYALRQSTALSALATARLERYATGRAEPITPSPAEADLVKVASNLQFWNPIAGKGVSRPKPDGTSVGQLPEKLVDWFAEWMKFRALRHSLLAYRVGDDYKVFVLSPGEILLDFLAELRHDLLQKPMWGSVRLDIEAALTLAELLVRRSPAASDANAADRRRTIFRSSPRRVIRGLACAYFKSLGSATAAMNVSFLGLPGWFPVETPAQVEDWLTILAEYRTRLLALREENSDHIGPLLAWRDFISSGRLGASLDFFGKYAVLLMQQGEQLVPFTLANLRRVVVSYETESPALTQIIEDEGFKNIARAIRACTVNAQWHKRQLDTKRRSDPLRVDIRYGLAQDWRRVVERRDEFVEKLADFVAAYNAEAARRMEKGDPSETLISATDLQRVIQLIDTTRRPELVGRLLIAFGYASDWKQRGATQPSAAGGPDGGTMGEDA